MESSQSKYYLDYFTPKNGYTTYILSWLLLGLLIVILVTYHWKRRHLYYVSWKLPGPFAVPLLGCVSFFTNSTEVALNNVQYLATTYKPALRIWLGPELYVALSDPKHLEIVLNSPHALNKAKSYKFMEPLLGLGLLTAPVSIWKPHRKMISPMFNQKVLNSFIPVFEEHARALLKSFEPLAATGEITDIYEIVGVCTLDTICETAMNVKTDKQEENKLAKPLMKAAEIICWRMCNPHLHPDIIFNTFFMKKLTDHTNCIKEMANQILQLKKKEYFDNKQSLVEADGCRERTKSILELMIDTSALTDEELVNEAMTLIVTGSDTTATNTGLTLIMLGMHPEIQQKIYEEIDSIYCGKDRPVTSDDLAQMKLLERAIKETLRLFPVGPLLLRNITQDIDCGDFVIPTGAICAIPVLVVHRDPAIWPDPLKYDPDRHLPEEQAKRHPFAYMPFSMGARNCIGWKYGLMQLKTILSLILRDFRVKTSYKKVSDIRLKMDIVSKVVEGYNVGFERRE